MKYFTVKNVFWYFLLFAVLVALPSCAHKNAPTESQIEQQGAKLKDISRSKAISVVTEPYLGAKLVPLRLSESPALNTKITLRRKGTLSTIAENISTLTSLNVQVSSTIPDMPASAGKPQGEPADLVLPPLSGLGGGGDSGKVLHINYEGTVRGLLDHIATQSGYGWDYDARGGTVVFAHMVVRTYTIIGLPGTVAYDSQITNKSKENTGNGSLGGGRGVNQSVSTADSTAQTSQTNTSKLKFDIWQDTEKVVKSLLSKNGSVVGNQSAGTLTVRDKPENIRQISAFIDDTNTRLSRQIALNVQVWALQVDDTTEAGLDLQAMFANDNISIVAGSLSSLGMLNTASATIVSGKLKNSTAVLKALKQWGRATQVTSGGGLVLSNQPVPVLAVKKIGYLAGANTFQGDYGQTSEITPGEVTTGFSMTVIPHILDKRRVLLQYNVNLSSLDSMVEFKTADIAVQLPQVSTRAFSQRTRMQMGQTLVLAGFQEETQGVTNGVGLLAANRKAQYGKTLLVITIEVESADMGGM